jgi:hypothetical protein
MLTLDMIEGAITPTQWEGVTTPPIPSSSPAYGADSMDISPLPHKVPFSLIQSKLDSPCRKHLGREADADNPMDTIDSEQIRVPTE